MLGREIICLSGSICIPQPEAELLLGSLLGSLCGCGDKADGLAHLLALCLATKVRAELQGRATVEKEYNSGSSLRGKEQTTTTL